MSSPSPWGSFTDDPRRPEAAGLRAADRDRDVVLGVLVEGYADGRLTKEEYDERSAATAAAKTLGELPVLILDLVPERPARRDDLALATSQDLHARAVQKWESQRRHALSGLLVPSLICWVVWAVTAMGGFPWPLFVMLGTGANLLRVLLNRTDIVLEEESRLEKKQRKAVESTWMKEPKDE